MWRRVLFAALSVCLALSPAASSAAALGGHLAVSSPARPLPPSAMDPSPASPSHNGSITIPQSLTVPTVDGICGTVVNEYTDVTPITFTVGVYPVVVWVKHSLSHLNVCMAGLIHPAPAVRNGPNAVVYIDRLHGGASQPNADTLAFSISFSGTVRMSRGSPAGYDGPAPLGFNTIARHVQTEPDTWSAEFAISNEALGGGEWNRTLGLAVAQQWVSTTGDDYGWPSGYNWFEPVTWADGNLTTTPGASTFDAVPGGVEVTQAIQDSFNSVVLVAGKRTFVRASVSGNETRGQVTARLTGWRAGVQLWPQLQPLNLGGSIVVHARPRRASLNDSFLFELPASWITPGTISFTVQINPFHNPAESDYANNRLNTGSFTFQTTRPLRIRLNDVQYTHRNGPTIMTPALDQDLFESWVRRAYPISALFITRRVLRVMGTDNPLRNDIANAAGFVNGQMARSRQGFAGGDPQWLYVGMVHDSGGFMRGLTPWMPAWETATPAGWPQGFNPGGSSGWDFDGSYGDWYGAHEAGHALGRPHVGRNFTDIGCGADFWFFQQEYPYITATIGGATDGPFDTSDRFFGFDAGDARLGVRQAVVPNTWTDLMSYCANQWISDFTYTNLRTYINSAFPVSAAAAPAAPRVAGDFLLVMGEIVSSTQTAEFQHLARLDEAGSIPPLTPGAYAIKLFNAGNTELASYAFTPLTGTEDADALSILQIVNFVPGTRRVAIYSNLAGGEIGSAAVSANAPEVSNVTQDGGSSLPASGLVNVSWDATDADGDTLTYDLRYSPDNAATWRLLATGIPTTSVSVDAAELEGTGGFLQGYLRVVASDGVLTGQAESPKFSVEGKDPVVEIANPADGASFGYGQTFALEGDALDFEAGTLDGSSLEWSSDVDGSLGTGRLIHPALLSAGWHAITLQATDADGQSATDTIFVYIASDAELLAPASPLLDAAPANMSFLGEAGSTPAAQGIAVNNLEGSPLDWTAATNQPWVALETLDGSTPGVLTVTVSLAGMYPGTTRSAQITLTAPGADGSPLIIYVTAQAEGKLPEFLFLPFVGR